MKSLLIFNINRKCIKKFLSESCLYYFCNFYLSFCKQKYKRRQWRRSAFSQCYFYLYLNFSQMIKNNISKHVFILLLYRIIIISLIKMNKIVSGTRQPDLLRLYHEAIFEALLRRINLLVFLLIIK